MKKISLTNKFIINKTIHWCIIGMLLPISTLFIMDKGISLLEIGMLVAMQSATVMIFEVPSGALADNYGRKNVYIISIMMMCVAAVIYIFSIGLFQVSIGIVFMGISQALSSGTIDAWFVDEFNKQFPDGDLQSALAKSNVFTLISLGGSSLLAGILPMSIGTILHEKLHLSIYSINFIAEILLIIIQIILTKRLIVEEIHENKKARILESLKLSPKTLKNSLKIVAKNKSIFYMMLTTVAWGLGFSALEIYWQPQVKHILGEETKIVVFGIINAGYFFAGAIGSIIISPICKLFKGNLPRVLILIRSLLGITFIILALQKNIITFVIVYLLLYAINGMAESPYYTLFNNHVGNENRATLLSLESLFMKSGGIVGSLGMGFVTKDYSISIGWIIIGVVVITSASLFFKILIMDKNHNSSP